MNSPRYPRHVLQRVTDRKNRKLAAEDSDKITLDRGLDCLTTTDSQVVVEDSRSSARVPFDLFTELITPAKNVKKTQISKKLVTDFNNRKLSVDNRDEITMDHNFLNFYSLSDSREVVEDSQLSAKGDIDLFSELIPPSKSVSEPPPKTKFVKKSPVSRKNTQVSKTLVVENPIQRPQKKFIPTPKIVNIMREAQSELYSLMGLNQSSSDVSNLSNGSLEVSGVQILEDNPASNTNKKPATNCTNKESRTELPIFEGVTAFVDYKMYNDHSGRGVIRELLGMGAKIEKTFNLNVTHVVFHDGYRNTYTEAIKRNIPLVSASWVHYSKIAKKILNPVDYPPVNIEKYTKPPEFNFNNCKPNNLKCLRPSDYERDENLKSKCDDLMHRIKHFQLDLVSENKENCDIIETSKKTEPLKEQHKVHQTNDIIDVLSERLHQILNTNDSQMLDEENVYVPMSIKVLRKYLSPNGRENKSCTELNDEIFKIEDRLKLNPKARQRFRKLLFPSDKDLNNSSIVSDFPSPSPQKLRISAPARLICKKKKKQVCVEEKLPHKNVINNGKTPPQEKNNKQNFLQWRIPTDLRPKKVKKIEIKNKVNGKITQTQTQGNSMFSRSSSMIFQTPKPSINSPEELQSIACTGLTKCEIDIIKLSIKNLGSCVFHAKVDPTTTYVVTKSQPNRTLNIVFAMAFGCFIISEEWVLNSHNIGRWLPYQEYLISDLSEPVKNFQIRRQTFGSLLTFHIFDDAGTIYISNTCDISVKDLKRLVRSCGGQCTNILTSANVVVGSIPLTDNNISEKWILDCISQGKLLDKYQYRLD